MPELYPSGFARPFVRIHCRTFIHFPRIPYSVVGMVCWCTPKRIRSSLESVTVQTVSVNSTKHSTTVIKHYSKHIPGQLLNYKHAGHKISPSFFSLATAGLETSYASEIICKFKLHGLLTIYHNNYQQFSTLSLVHRSVFIWKQDISEIGLRLSIRAKCT